MNLIMIRYQFLLKFIFSCLILLTGCESNTTAVPSNEINNISFGDVNKGKSQTFSIYIDNEEIGTCTSNITTGILDPPYISIIRYKETIQYNESNGEINTYFKEYADGYTFYEIGEGPSLNKYLPLPLKYGETLYGPFGVINPNMIRITIVDFHSTYTNKNNHTFSNVFEASNNSGTVRIFLNETYFIIQKEDLRYASTIQSLKLN